MTLQRHIQRARAAMATMRLGNPGDQGPKRSFGEPFWRPSAKDPVSHRALARDDKHAPDTATHAGLEEFG